MYLINIYRFDRVLMVNFELAIEHTFARIWPERQPMPLLQYEKAAIYKEGLSFN